MTLNVPASLLHLRPSHSSALLVLAGYLSLAAACSSSTSEPGSSGGSTTGGTTAKGGSAGNQTGGTLASGGMGQGGVGVTGGAPALGGSGGVSGGGSANGGSANGGATSGGTSSAGTTNGGSTSGGTAGGGVAGSSGASGAAGNGGTAGSSASGGSGNGGSAGSGSGCLICDDFESGTTLDAAKWMIDASMGAAAGKAEIVSGGAHGSSKAVKVSGGYIKVALQSGLFAAVSAKFYVRLNMKFDMAQPSDHVTYLMFDDQTHQLRVGAQNGGMIWNYDSTDSILPDYNAAAMSLKPGANEWHCFEFQIDSNTPALHVSMDGTESMQMLLDGTPTQGIDDRWSRDMPGWKPKITNFSFGSGYPTAGKVTLWVDDVAISNSPIGCTF